MLDKNTSETLGGMFASSLRFTLDMLRATASLQAKGFNAVRNVADAAIGQLSPRPACPSSASALAPASPPKTRFRFSGSGAMQRQSELLVLVDEDLEQSLAFLRQEWGKPNGELAVLKLAEASVLGKFPDQAEGINAAAAHLYTQGPGPLSELEALKPPAGALTKRERELILISTLSSAQVNDGEFTALHMYWGLMEGLSAKQVAGALQVVGIYHGLHHYVAGAKVLEKILEIVRSEGDPARTPGKVEPPRNGNRAHDTFLAVAATFSS
jgi:alkylhydroperoxidase/carboxymuconolactone decarboxylase family protein YurZ